MTPAQQVETVLGVVTVEETHPGRMWSVYRDGRLIGVVDLFLWCKEYHGCVHGHGLRVMQSAWHADLNAAVCWVAEQQKGQSDGA